MLSERAEDTAAAVMARLGLQASPRPPRLQVAPAMRPKRCLWQEMFSCLLVFNEKTASDQQSLFAALLNVSSSFSSLYRPPPQCVVLILNVVVLLLLDASVAFFSAAIPIAACWPALRCALVCTRTKHSQKAGPFSVGRLKVKLAFPQSSRVHAVCDPPGCRPCRSGRRRRRSRLGPAVCWRAITGTAGISCCERSETRAGSSRPVAVDKTAFCRTPSTLSRRINSDGERASAK